MTPKEAELLRAVAEAASDWRDYQAAQPIAGGRMMELYGNVSAAVIALSAYRAQPQEAEGEMVTMGLIRSRLSRTLSGTMTPEDEDPRDWEHIGNIVFPMPPAIVIPTVSASITGNIEP